MTPEQHREHAVDLIVERARYGEQPSVLKYLEMAGVEHTVEDAKAIFALIGTAAINVWFSDNRAHMSHPYARALLAEIDKLNAEIERLREQLGKAVDVLMANGWRQEADRLDELAKSRAAVADSLGGRTDPHPDCQHERHGADGGKCPGCGWDSHPIPTPDKAKPGAASAAPGCKNTASVTHTFTFTCQACGKSVQVTDGDAEAHPCPAGVVISGNDCCGGNGVEASCDKCRTEEVAS